MGLPKRGYTNTFPEFTEGNKIAQTHACWSRDVPVEAKARAAEIFGADAYGRHPLVAVRAAECWLRLRRAEAWLELNGDQDEDGEPRSILAAVGRWDGYLLKVATVYGMTPLSEAQVAQARGEALVAAQSVHGRALGFLDKLEERRDKQAKNRAWVAAQPPSVLRPPGVPASPPARVIEDAVVVEDEDPGSVLGRALSAVDAIKARLAAERLEVGGGDG